MRPGLGWSVETETVCGPGSERRSSATACARGSAAVVSRMCWHFPFAPPQPTCAARTGQLRGTPHTPRSAAWHCILLFCRGRSDRFGPFEPPLMKNIVYFDLETQKSADEVGGWDKISSMRMSIGVTYSTSRGGYAIYGEDHVNELIRELQRADLIV